MDVPEILNVLEHPTILRSLEKKSDCELPPVEMPAQLVMLLIDVDIQSPQRVSSPVQLFLTKNAANQLSQGVCLRGYENYT